MQAIIERQTLLILHPNFLSHIKPNHNISFLFLIILRIIIKEALKLDLLFVLRSLTKQVHLLNFYLIIKQS